jgi:hypothetical protein
MQNNYAVFFLACGNLPNCLRAGKTVHDPGCGHPDLGQIGGAPVKESGINCDTALPAQVTDAGFIRLISSISAAGLAGGMPGISRHHCPLRRRHICGGSSGCDRL